MQFNATVKDMLETQKSDRAIVTIETPGSMAHLKRVLLKHDGLGLVVYKPGPPDKEGKLDPDKIYVQGRISGISLDDPITYNLTGKSWFLHGPDNIAVTIK